MSEDKERFLGTFFDRGGVLQMARLFLVLSWIVVVIFAADLLVGLGTFALQYARGFLSGMGFTDLLQQILFTLDRPVHGMIYFAILQTLGRGLLIGLDLEENTRRAARKQG